MFSHFVLFLAIFLAILIAFWYYTYFYFYMNLRYFPQMKQLPLVGGALEFSSTTVLYKRLLELRNELGVNFWTMLGPEPVLFTADPEIVKKLLTSQLNIEKSQLYTFLHEWIGLGLLTSSGEKWRNRRRLITPAFNFKVLENLTETLNGCSDILVKKLSLELDKTSTDIYEHIVLCALDGLCETIMGIRVNVQTDTDSDFVKSVKEMARIPFERQFRILEKFTLTYCFTENYKTEKTHLKYLHKFTDSVIRRRLKELKNANTTEGCESKKKLAFLDLLLNYSVNNLEFSAMDLREEVNTFMFAGHDTISSGISFTMFLLANNINIQTKAFTEIRNIFGEDTSRVATFKDFQEMKYLELVIKESLRIYPPGPLFGRKLSHDLEIDGYALPKGLTVFIMLHAMNNNPNLFSNPDVFNPERFLDEPIRPFDFIPFSAGPRNCIGQKFAMLSMKSILSKVLRNFVLLPVKHDLELAIESTLKSKNGIPVKLIERKW